MGGRKAVLRVLLLAVAWAAALWGPGLPAQADCLSVEVRIWTSGNPTPSRPLGEKYCVTSTPWNEGFRYNENQQVGVVPTGYPNGYGLTVWVPAP